MLRVRTCRLYRMTDVAPTFVRTRKLEERILDVLEYLAEKASIYKASGIDTARDTVARESRVIKTPCFIFRHRAAGY